MKITSAQGFPRVTTITNGGTAAGSARKTNATGADRVEMSSSNQEINKFKTMLQQVSDTSIEKIPQIKQQLNGGTYHVEAREVAEKMLNRWKDFTG
jgi:flagellar biosynthesis anti-sigma factor FlgM